jgi:hypothetical protein
MILDRLAIKRYIVRTSFLVLMLANQLRGGGYWVSTKLSSTFPVSILINQLNYMFGGEIC